jgi:ribosomal protein L24, bacterial/organelle
LTEVKKLHVKKEDKVVILSGKDKGKEGKVKESQPKKDRVIVEGVNMVSRHSKPSQKSPQGGIVRKEAPVHASNVMLVCPSCKKPTRIQKKELADKSFARACKKCGELIDKK